MKIEIRLLHKNDDLSSFDCGIIELNQFLKQYAKQNQFRHFIGTTYVAVVDNIIIGYLSVSASSIRIADFSNELSKKLPKYPLPVLRLTRLGIDVKYQNIGIGKQLLKFTLGLTLKQKEQFGCFALVVDAKAQSVGFYEAFGFESVDVVSGTLDIRPYAQSMFLATKVIEKSLRRE
ncbi:MAG TPA: GNAT family N-acetyltransferase [Campylobacterales bacterium]|jgi:GNAT superfamily N-acetyltransferase|nr:GNAT family N-acetyltransferase [Campylobacterales bacterium]